MTPLQGLATALAYVIRADNVTMTSEKANMVALLHKHVIRGEPTEQGLKDLTAKAFEMVEKVDLGRFVEQAPKGLTEGQKMAILINLYDAMLVDGKVVDGEVQVIRKFEKAFGADRDTMKAVHEVLALKNDTTVFTNFLNPKNEPDYRLDVGRKR